MTTIIYFPDKGISLNDIKIEWGFDRQVVRELLGNFHNESNTIIDLSLYHNGDKEFNIIQRRDIYENHGGDDNYFFLNYGKDDTLKEIEIHKGVLIFIGDIRLSFDTDFQEAVLLLKNISKYNNQISVGEHFYKDLKLTIANREFMGSEGNKLAYFYCSQNIDHLENA